MAVLLGAIKKYKTPSGFSSEDYVSIEQFYNPKDKKKNMYYVNYYAIKDGKNYKIASPIYTGTYEDNEHTSNISKWIKSIGGKINAQYNRLINYNYKLSSFKRGHK